MTMCVLVYLFSKLTRFGSVISNLVVEHGEVESQT